MKTLKKINNKQQNLHRQRMELNKQVKQLIYKKIFLKYLFLAVLVVHHYLAIIHKVDLIQNLLAIHYLRQIQQDQAYSLQILEDYFQIQED